MSAIRHPTEKILEFIDLNLRPHVEELPSYLKDTKKIPFSGLTEETLLVTMYVTLLYTNNHTRRALKHAERQEPSLNFPQNS